MGRFSGSSSVDTPPALLPHASSYVVSSLMPPYVEEGDGLDEIDAGRVVVQFGKRGREDFSLDFSYPLSPVQAFALALSSLDDKLCYSI